MTYDKETGQSVRVFFFFFKQKTAYEMRISDWSSDVCSSDLGAGGGDTAPPLVVMAACDPNSFARDARVLVDAGYRSEERRVGKEGVSTCRSRWSSFH